GGDLADQRSEELLVSGQLHQGPSHRVHVGSVAGARLIHLGQEVAQRAGKGTGTHVRPPTPLADSVVAGVIWPPEGSAKLATSIKIRRRTGAGHPLSWVKMAGLGQARAAEARVIGAEHDAEVARAEFHGHTPAPGRRRVAARDRAGPRPEPPARSAD